MAKANITPADYSNEFLLIHTLNCDKQLGKCSVPGCGIAKGVFEYLLGKRELLKDTIYPIFKRSFVEESSGKRRKLRDGERERLLLPYPPRPDDFIKKEVEYTLSSDSKGSLSSPNLVECLTNDQLRKYLYSLKIRPLQTLYGPLILSLMQHKENRDMFNVPVDPVKLNIPYYFTVIKNPMDLGTIRDRLSSGYYKEAKEIERDIELVFSNAMTFNPKENVVHIAAQKLLRFYHSELEKVSFAFPTHHLSRSIKRTINPSNNIEIILAHPATDIPAVSAVRSASSTVPSSSSAMVPAAKRSFETLIIISFVDILASTVRSVVSKY